MAAEVDVVGITGHQNLTPEAIPAIRRAIQEAVESRMPVVGLTALAEGADQVFAEVLLALGAKIIAVVPSRGYIATFKTLEAKERHTRLLSKAKEVIELPYERPTEAAFLAAGQEVVNRSNLLLAVWDGQPSGGPGGTADIVAYARERGVPTAIIWPHGARRSRPSEPNHGASGA